VLDRLWQDLRYAARGFVRTPLFALTALLSVALGVGAVTAIATIANALLLRPPAGVGHPERVVSVGRTTNGSGFDNMSYPVFLDYRDGTTALSALAATQIEPRHVSLAGPDGGEPIQASVVSGNFFSVLETRPALGRFFLPEEDRVPGAAPVVVLSHRFWTERFDASRSVLDSTIVLNGHPFTVVGVAGEGFQGPYVLAPDAWVPVMAVTLLGQSEDMLQARQSVWLTAMGRLAPGASAGTAEAELAAIAARSQLEYPDVNRGHGVRVLPVSLFPGDLRGMVASFLSVLLALSALVLVIASTNVAGMLLARAARRRREIAVRLAIGASRRQLARQLTVESAVLFVAAGLAGVLVARWLVAGLLGLIPRLPVQLAFDASMDWRVFAFSLGSATLAGVVAGLVPGVQATHPELVPALKSDTAGTRRQRLRSALLVAQITFSMLLLIVAGLFARGLTRAKSIDPGFAPANVELASMDLRLANYDSLRGGQLADELLERAAALPGAENAALATVIPLDGNGLGLGGIDVPGRTPPDEERGWDADWNVITPGYFETLRIPIVRGRAFSSSDRAGAPDVAIINETFARALWPGEDPIGRTFRNDDRSVTVVGVARDSKYRSLGESRRNFVYVPLAQRYLSRLTLFVRERPGTALGGAIRRTIAELDRSLPILRQRTFEEHAAISLFPQRVALWVAGSLGSVALLLALLGIYGVTAFSVAQRTREIGVRAALGASRGQILRPVLRQGLVLAGVGVLLGAVAAAAITRLVAGLLYGVAPTDLAAFAGAALVLVAAAIAGSWIPARRAAAIDPASALRSE
jgi:predicted permease